MNLSSFHKRLITTIPLLRGTSTEIVAIRSKDGHQIVLSAEEALVLSEASSALTGPMLRDRVRKAMTDRRLIAQSPDQHVDGNSLVYEEAIRNLLRLRLLQTEEEFISSLSTTSHSLIGQTAETLCLLTCDRPEQARRALTSLISCSESSAQQFSKPESCVVVDDSRAPESVEATQRELDQVLNSQGLPISYIRRSERRGFIARLSERSHIAPEVVTFGLHSPEELTTEGASRNTIALFSAGSPVVSFDDDTFCCGLENCSVEKPVSICRRPFPYELWLDEETLHRKALEIRQYPWEPRSAHMQVLGAPVSEVVRRAGKLADWPTTQSSSVSYRSVKEGRVGITTMGSLGDPGIHSMGGILVSASDSTIARLCVDPTEYLRAMRTRQVLRMTQNVTLSREACLQTMTVGIDNTTITPPFFPYGRNLDGLYVATSLAVDPNVWICHLPHVIGHMPVPPRADVAPYVQAFSRLRLNDLLILITRNCCLSVHNTVRQNLVGLGAWFRSLGELDEPQLNSYVASLAVQRQLSLLNEVDRRIEAHRCYCAPYVKDLKLVKESVRASLRDALLIIPSDLKQRAGAAPISQQFREALARYGCLLEAWPDLWDAAYDLHRVRTSTD